MGGKPCIQLMLTPYIFCWGMITKRTPTTLSSYGLGAVLKQENEAEEWSLIGFCIMDEEDRTGIRPNTPFNHMGVPAELCMKRTTVPTSPVQLQSRIPDLENLEKINGTKRKPILIYIIVQENCLIWMKELERNRLHLLPNPQGEKIDMDDEEMESPEMSQCFTSTGDNTTGDCEPRTFQRSWETVKTMSHQGITKCRTRAKDHVWLPGIGQEIQDMVKTCEKCIENQPPKHEPHIPKTFRPWQKVEMKEDYEGSEYSIVVGYFSHQVVRLTKKAVVDHCKAIFALHGIPDIGEKEQRKMAQKTAFDRRHTVTKKAELIAGEKVWVKDLRAEFPAKRRACNSLQRSYNSSRSRDEAAISLTWKSVAVWEEIQAFPALTSFKLFWGDVEGSEENPHVISRLAVPVWRLEPAETGTWRFFGSCCALQRISAFGCLWCSLYVLAQTGTKEAPITQSGLLAKQWHITTDSRQHI
ncbi:K02A2.6-like [Cordylochernes scorpioides]|uniref:RNA-directed DNA polymerase n=1 Tax=Cordylochernes scorpioides TaxID=51811 RepID=A0ABY6JXW7_9ARAC|nr:K02A2.6-like [Cordylochernes scorpioides]